MHYSPKKLPSAKYLKARFFLYGGQLYWRQGQHAGKVAGYLTLQGYRAVRLRDGLFMAHRIVYKMFCGAEPLYIDHINGDPSDNNFLNLRSVTHAVNCGNHKKYKNNKSGYRGVRQIPSGRWRATVQNKGKQLHLGMYDSSEEASEVVELVRKELGYTPRGG